jgi:phosphatidylglycerophosphate synthase
MLIVQPANRELLRSALGGILALVLLSLPLTLMAKSRLDLSAWYSAKALVVLCVGAALILQGLPEHHPFRSIGPANLATGARGVLVALLVALVGERVSESVQYIALAIGVIAATLDGLDGWLARRSNMTSQFGARFDMETDALLILTLAVLAWQFGKAGVWVVLSGLLRYAFVLAGVRLPWLRAPLFPSLRRKAVAVVQTIALLFVMTPLVPPAVAGPIAAGALLALALSFLIDVVWLKREAARDICAA